MIDNWKDLPLGAYKKITEIDPQDEEGNLKVLAILEGKTLNDILNAPLTEVKEKVKKLDFLTKKPRKHLIKLKYKLGEKTYRFDCTTKSITTAQFIDFSQTAKEDLVGALSIFLIPEGKRYNEDYDLDDAKADIEKYLSVEEALSICDFFTTLSLHYLRRTLRKAKKALKQAKRDGIPTEEAEKMIAEYERLISYTGSLQWTP